MTAIAPVSTPVADECSAVGAASIHEALAGPKESAYVDINSVDGLGGVFLCLLETIEAPPNSNITIRFYAKKVSGGMLEVSFAAIATDGGSSIRFFGPSPFGAGADWTFLELTGTLTNPETIDWDEPLEFTLGAAGGPIRLHVSELEILVGELPVVWTQVERPAGSWEPVARPAGSWAQV